MTSYSLLQLNEHIRRFVALNAPEAVWVQAEIAEADERRGHYYLSLVEKAKEGEHLIAQSQAVFWAPAARKWQRSNKISLLKILRAGQEVQVKVLVDFHERYGLKLIIEDIDPAFTLGQLVIRKQETIDSLRADDLFTLNKEKELVLVPQRLAIISSPIAAGLADFMEQLNQNSYGYQFRTKLFEAAMQGEQASPEIRRKLQAINRRKDYFDAIVIIRGGGAKTDLADFDDLQLCQIAAEAELPIIAGIGHQTDESVLDMIVHSSVKTPTAAADFLINKLVQFEQSVLLYGQYVQQVFQNRVGEENRSLFLIQQELLYKANQASKSASWQLNSAQKELKMIAQATLQRHKLQLSNSMKTNEVLSLETALSRGFVWLSKGQKAIRSPKELKKGDSIQANFKDGKRTLRVDD